MRAHLPETPSYWFQTLPMRWSALHPPLPFSCSRPRLLISARPCILPLHLFHPSRRSSLPSARRSPRWHLFLLHHFYRRGIARSQFVRRQIPPSLPPSLLPRCRSRKEVHTALGTASKNDYSEINNNDITARRDRYARKWFSSADLDSLGVWCLMSASRLMRW